MPTLQRLAALLALLLCAVPLPGAARAETAVQSTQARYLVLRIEADSSLTVVHHEIVAMETELETLSDAEMAARMAASSAQIDVVSIVLRSKATSEIVYQNTTEVAEWQRGEFHGDPLIEDPPPIDGYHFELAENNFAVRVPVISGATLELYSEALLPSTAIIDLDTLTYNGGEAAAADVQVMALPGWSNGPPINRLDVLIIGDGYTAAQQTQFNNDALNVANAFMAISPFSVYGNYVNIDALFIASNQSGADHPVYNAACVQTDPLHPTCCPEQQPGGGPGSSTFVSTAFDATFCAYGIQRLLIVDTGKVFTAAAAKPDWDTIIVIVNDAMYGGSGGTLAVASMHASAVPIIQHEFGHSFMLLADEYSTAYPGYPTCSDTIPGATPCEPNVTDANTRATVKWNYWIAPATAVPTINPPILPTDAGAWQGARYQTTGMYRQGYNCIMRTLSGPYCTVDGEQFPLRLYGGGWGVPAGGIANYEPGTLMPPVPSVTIPVGGSMPFHAILLGPAGGPLLTVNWYVAGMLVSTTNLPTGAPTQYVDAPTSPGSYTITLEIIDNSPLVNNANRAAATTTYTWQVTAQYMPPDKPPLISPANASTINDAAPTFQWTDVGRTTQYQLVIKDSAGNTFLKKGYDPALFCAGGVCAVSLVTEGLTLAHGETYNWKVVAKNDTGKTTSDKWTFTTDLVPAAFNLLSPPDASSVATTTPTLQWQEAARTDSYKVSIKDNKGNTVFSQSVSPATVCSGGTCSVSVTTALKDGKTYTWKVVAKNAFGKTKSAKWTFTVDLP